MKRLAGLMVVLLAIASPALAKEVELDGSLDQDGLHAGITQWTERGEAGTAEGRPFHYEYVYRTGSQGCADGVAEQLWRVWDDTARRELIRSGCPQVRTDRPAPPPPPSAAQVRDAVGIPTPVIGVNPATRGLTGMLTYVWYEGPTERTVTVTLNGYTVTATAHATSFEWHMGDGHTYTTSSPGSPSNPAVKHAYATKGTPTISVRVTWTGTYTFSAGGVTGNGSLGSVAFAGSRPYPVDEVQAVGTGT